MQTLHSHAVLDGLGFPEGIRYHDGLVWFSDIFDFKVICWDPATGRKRVVAELDDKPSGLGFLPDGTLLVATIGTMQLLRIETCTTRLVADLRALCGDGFHLNDMVVDAAGRAYIGAIDDGDHAGRPSKIVVVEPDGTGHVGAGDLANPNGLAITADGSTLIVAETADRAIVAFDRNVDDGALNNRRVLAQLEAFPDGLCVDAEDAVWVGIPFAGEFRRIAPGGTVTHRVVCAPGRVAVAPMLGGAGRRTLYLCTAHKLGLGEHFRAMEHPARLPEVIAASQGAIDACDGIDVPGAGWP